MNFTHRIDRLQFGGNYPGLVNPLDHAIQITEECKVSCITFYLNIDPKFNALSSCLPIYTYI
jgi:hypothetical protein